MELLVSVRSADEVKPAIAGGADIIDAKEPARGSLGPVDRDVLSRILRRIPADHAVSVALGDLTTPAEAAAALEPLPLRETGSVVYLKLGFARVRSSAQIGRLIETAVSIGRGLRPAVRVVAVAYADSTEAGTVAPFLIPPLAGAAGAAGVLLDTYRKNGRGLLDWIPPQGLADWVGGARQAGLLAALAGSLGRDDLPLACQARPDVVGIRGAACRGGREGRVSELLVRRFRRALERAEWGVSADGPAALRETQDTGAISSRATTAKSRKLKA